MPLPQGHARQVVHDLQLIAADGPGSRQVLLQQHRGWTLERLAAEEAGPKGDDRRPLLARLWAQLKGVIALNLCHLRNRM